jgi:transposase
MVPTLRKQFPNSNGVFQWDLVPCHNSKLAKSVFTQQHLKVLEWPGNSPDLNPIENLWAIIKACISKMDCRTKTKLTESVMKVW